MQVAREPANVRNSVGRRIPEPFSSMLPPERRVLPARSLVSKYQGVLAPMLWMALELIVGPHVPAAVNGLLKLLLPSATTLPATTSRTPPALVPPSSSGTASRQAVDCRRCRQCSYRRRQ